MNSGIYMILNKTTNKYYIGSAKKFDIRWNKHKSDLNLNKHDNDYLQKSWNKYGKENFQFYVLENCLISQLVEREQYWINKSKCYNRNFGYNLRQNAESNIGIKFSDQARINMRLGQLGNKQSEITKEKHRKRMLGNHNTKERKQTKEEITRRSISNTGKKRSNEFRIQMSNLHRDKSKWPCLDGYKCKCKNCMYKKRGYDRLRYKNKISGEYHAV